MSHSDTDKRQLHHQSVLVRPLNTPITPLCTSLTTLTWEHVKNAGSFREAINAIDVYISEIVDAGDQLTAIGAPPGKDDVVDYILVNLHSDWAVIQSQLISHAGALTLDTVTVSEPCQYRAIDSIDDKDGVVHGLTSSKGENRYSQTGGTCSTLWWLD